MSAANADLSASSVIAFPPYLTTTILSHGFQPGQRLGEYGRFRLGGYRLSGYRHEP